MDNENRKQQLCRQLWREWEELQSTRPSNPKRTPTPEELEALRAFKIAKSDFIEQIPPELIDWFNETRKETKGPEEARRNRRRSPKPPKQPKIQLFARTKPVTLGWIPSQSFRFHLVIPFLSHARRSRYEELQDMQTFGGIDRRVFSNLYMDKEPLEIVATEDETLMGHARCYSQAVCAESYYMAAKARDPWDARFIMEELTNSFDVASYGHNRLRLTTQQRNRLIQFGCPPDDFQRTNDDGTHWLRGKDGRMPVREKWAEERHNVFFFILRQKFGPAAVGASKATIKALMNIIQKGSQLPLMVEHRRLDTFWGDGLFGDGTNVLGKVLTQIVLERAGLSEIPPAQLWSDIAPPAKEPNSALVRYVGIEESKNQCM